MIVFVQAKTEKNVLRKLLILKDKNPIFIYNTYNTRGVYIYKNIGKIGAHA